MSLAPTLDQQTADGATEVDELLVLWQHPLSREIVPIGRFGRTLDSYTFTYTQAAADVSDFRPLPGLPDLHARYESAHIPAVFGQRVMGSGRRDFARYASTLGLKPGQATPWEQIVRSGGRRAGDTLQFMSVPVVSNGRATAQFLVNGVRHIPDGPRSWAGQSRSVSVEEQEAALQSLEQGSSVMIAAEDNNPKDVQAALVTCVGVPVGWVPRALSPSIRELITLAPVQATVVRIGGPETPPHVRLTVSIDAPAPRDFQFDRAGDWDPIPMQ